MKYTIRARNDRGAGPFFVWVPSARSALNIVRDLTDHGMKGLDVLDRNGKRYDLIELERLAVQGA